MLYCDLICVPAPVHQSTATAEYYVVVGQQLFISF